MRPKGIEELTDPENEKLLATLTHEAWRGLSVESIAAKWFRLDPDVTYLLELPNPLELLIHEARQSSGSIKGEHRKDIKDAVIGSPAQSVGLSVPIIHPNGGGNGAASDAPKTAPKRGF